MHVQLMCNRSFVHFVAVLLALLDDLLEHGQLGGHDRIVVVPLVLGNNMRDFLASFWSQPRILTFFISFVCVVDGTKVCICTSMNAVYTGLHIRT